ncbi:A/G-specific adenine glycosylase [Luteithermobacter gelatinilyticus]|uniref:A/G-specific adenine glycosylase n=1 Tax=Luteithermobacter gelatinilyticus TaxID=2582913 RepID=UPI00110628ED|nr:A/G-specific adenine glycosylase [Luteithermobacter gelatinilyticus]
MTTAEQDILLQHREDLADMLLDWYDTHARTLPWRISPEHRKGGLVPDPYEVWLSEIMLQQTTVATVIPYFTKFIEKWPTVKDLAQADLDDVLVEWAGLGYYARARNLHKCAQVIAYDLDGIFPTTEGDLRKLPGIGPYTAAAIAAIAFDEAATVVDGNVERVMARLFDVHTPLPDARPVLREFAEKLTPTHRPGDYAQAVMDLGATVCTPRALKCNGRCPWEAFCLAARTDSAEELPKKTRKAEKPTRRGFAFWGEFDGKLWLRRRPENGLLGGMMEVPTSDWIPSNSWDNFPPPRVPIIANWRELPGLVRHTFTHFHLELKVIRLELEEMINLQEGEWVPLDQLDKYALPTVMKKIIDHVREPVLDL